MSNTTFFCGSSELVQLDRTIGVYWFKKSRTSGAWNRIVRTFFFVLSV
uniref:Uncharacterized protein n=1 Tax=Aegilops tauschii subsp. strangulata TaxID=200361 RepID=A0A452Z6R2_AEGTS